jgi:hypothetical protein
MRLTLRTLLAYLDDTLDPGEIKPIGQKVAESDAAQELIARIKQITRQRRLTTPPLTGPGAKFDANAVAEYLDNELPSEQVSELEKTCLESDVHLAEIATCHQILTLVLGEPALVPPTAKERMYQLVEGREAIPYRKAPASTTSIADSQADSPPDESPLLGLSFFRRPGTIRWLLPIAAVLLIAALGIAIWLALPNKQPTYYAGTDPNKTRPPTDKDAGPGDRDKEEKDRKEKVEADRKEKEEKERIKEKEEADRKEKERIKEKEERDRKEKEEKDKPPRRIGKAPPPRMDPVPIGNYQLPERLPSVLVHRPGKSGDAPYKRLAPGAAVQGGMTLMSLPGYTSQIETKSGIGLTLRGHVPEFSVDPLMDFLLESEVTLHAPPDGIDLDLTLSHGRVYFADLKDKKDAVVRLRFLEQVWDVTLKDGAEVGVDLIKRYAPGADYLKEEPTTSVALFILQGKAEVTVNNYPKATKLEAPPPPGLALMQWDSHTDQPPEPIPVPAVPLIWSHASPTSVLSKQYDRLSEAFSKAKVEEAQKLKPLLDFYNDQRDRAKKMVIALGELSDLLGENKSLELALEVQRLDMNRERRRLAVYGLGAIGELDKLLATLTDEDPEHVDERDNAVFVLRRYLSRGLDAGRVLFHDDGRKKSGLLVEKYGVKDGEKVFTLLHDFNPKDLTPAAFGLLVFYLKSENLAVRDLAFWHLDRMTLGLEKKPAYNAAAPRQVRDAAADAYQKMLDDGQIPPKR